MSSPRQLGRNFARAQDALSTRDETLRSVEARLANTVEKTFLGAPGFKMSVRSMAMVFAVAVAVAGVWLWRHGDAPLTLRINGALVSGGTSDWIDTKAGQFDALHFSDGSQIQLMENSRSRCLDVKKKGAQIRLSKGRLQATIVSSPDADWRFEAGPYTVVVTGTRFGLRWDADPGLLTVEMLEGSVRVAGPSASAGETVTAGQRLMAWADSKRVEITPWSVAGQEAAPRNRPATQTPTSSSGEIGTMQTPSSGGEALSKEMKPTSSNLSRKKPRIVDAVVRCPHADGAAALRNADDERRKAQWNSACNAYRTVLRCYPDSREASVAAFRLGKIAFDHQRDWQAAAKWFRRYLSASADVGLMREAQGRLLEALVNSHERSKAIDAAETYLRRYPRGPHASLAKKVQEDAHSFH